MSETKQRIAQELKEAMKNQDHFKRDTLRLLSSAMKQVEVDERRELSEEDVLTILKKAKKQREEAAAQYQSAGRADLYEKESAELRIIESYLPRQLSEEELAEALKSIITEVGASSPKDMGKVMGAASAKLGARVDGKRLSAAVREQLSAL